MIVFYWPYLHHLLRCYALSSFSSTVVCVFGCFFTWVSHLTPTLGLIINKQAFSKLPMLSLIFPENRKIQSGHLTLNLKTLTVFRAIHIVSRYGLLFRVSPYIQISRRYYSVFGKSFICYVWICVTRSRTAFELWGEFP